jgi:L-asparaginase/Glu-tRNA(Gln) amidotransferase subunit D
MMTNRPDLINEFKLAFLEKGHLMVLISQSFPEEPIRREMNDIFSNCGIISGHDLTLPAALAKMAVILTKSDLNLDQKTHLMSLNWQGEIS